MLIPCSDTYASTLDSLEMSGTISAEQSQKMWEAYKNTPIKPVNVKRLGLEILGFVILLVVASLFN